MVVKRLSLGESPHLEINRCDGNLDVRGLPRRDVALESSTPSFQVTAAEETAVVGKLEGDCAIRMPEQGHLRIGSVGGQLKIKGVQGTTVVEAIGGDCIVRHFGSLTVGHIDGNIHARHAGVAIALGTVGGNATLRDIDVPITITQVGGNFWGRNLPAGLQIEQVDGEIALHTDFAAGSLLQLAASGSMLFRVPSSANVRFRIPRQTTVQVDEGLQMFTEGEQKIIVMGMGAAEVCVTAAASVRVRSDETYDMDGECTFAFDGGIDAYMTDVSAKIDAQMSQIETRLNDLPGHVRTRVERKLEAAQRKVESALRDAEKAGERSHYRYSSQIVYPPIREPISEEERLTILRMLEKGTISVQEAENLLATLEKGA